MGQTQSQAVHKKIMPELLVFQENKLLLVKGIEGERVFWWPPGAYWICEKICDLEIEEPKLWIQRVLQSQIGVDVEQAALRSVNFIAPNHAPVFVYQVQVVGKPQPNKERGFIDADFFESNNLPTVLGRDHQHGSWLHELLNDYWKN